MVTKVGVLGSCISRDNFNSHFVPNYKEKFEVQISTQRTSLISLMQDPLSINLNSIKIEPESSGKSKTQFINYDLQKYFLDEIKKSNIEYLIMDNYFEIYMGILYFNDTIITNNFWDLPLTEFYENIDDKFVFRMTDYSEEFFLIWSKYCNLFFEFLQLFQPNVKVILTRAKQLEKVIRSDGTIYHNSVFSKSAKIINPLWERLDNYIIDNFDVITLNFDYEKIFLDENHIWGINPVHYSNNYNQAFFEKLNHIVNNNKKNKKNIIKSAELNDEILSKYEDFKNKLKITNLETKLFLKHIKLNQSLKFYNRARVDIKNFGHENNKIEIINSDIGSVITYPHWFKSNEGEGLVIENENNYLNLKFRCIGDGLLKIFLHGPDIRDKNSNRFPVYIDFTELIVNEEVIFDVNLLTNHDTPYIFKKEVKDSDIIDVSIKWKPFNNSSIYEDIN